MIELNLTMDNNRVGLGKKGRREPELDQSD